MDRFLHITQFARQMEKLTRLTSQMDAIHKAIGPTSSFMEKFSHTRLYNEQMEIFNKAIAPNMKFIEKFSSVNILNKQIEAFSKISPAMSYIAQIPSYTIKTPSYSLLNRQAEALALSAVDFKKFSISSELALKSLSAFAYPGEKIQSALNSYNRLLEGYIPNNSFEDTFKEVFRRVSLAENREAEEKINTVVEDLEAETQKVPITFLSAEFYISLIITLIIFVYSSNSQTEMETTILDKLSRVENTIIEKLEDQFLQQADFIYYVVLRAVQLKTKPHSKKSKTITFLYRNQTIRLIERKGKWIKVEYFNHITGVHENGWCLKKYLKIIGTAKLPQS